MTNGNIETGGSDREFPLYPSLFCNINRLPDGRFEVTAPGLIDMERERVSGATRFVCGSLEEAQAELKDAWRWTDESLDELSLGKSSGVYFSIERLSDSRFKVTVPGAQLLNTCFRIGTTRDFDSWSEAMEYYLQMRQEFEKVILKDPILEMQVSSDERIAFSDYDSYAPFVAPAKEPTQIPPITEKLIFEKEQLTSASTYKNTIQERGWERKLYAFIESYIKGEGALLLKKLGVKRLDALTPKQAMDISTHVVLDHTKYLKNLDEEDANPTDQKTVLQMLQEGRLHKDDEKWNGNGVCRNFASGVKAVFEALKANQTRFSLLNNTYCLYEAAVGSVYDPKRQSRKTLSLELPSGHAWNTFVTISKNGEASATIADITWAKRDLETQEVTGIDHTLTRMEPVVFVMAQAAEDNDERRKVLPYYALKINHKKTRKEEKWFFASQAMALIREHKMFADLHDELVEGISAEYETHPAGIDRNEIETLWEIAKHSDQLNFDIILSSYLETALFTLSSHFRSFGYMAEPDLQRKVFEWMEQNYSRFEEYLETNMGFRIRMREISPKRLPSFSPAEREADAKELIRLINNSQFFRYSSLRPEDCTTERVVRIFDKVKGTLQARNPNRFAELTKGMSDYDLLKNYDSLARHMST